MESAEGFAAEFLAQPAICRRLLKFQSQVEEQPADTSTIAAGDTVLLRGIVKLPELNGKSGVVKHKNPDGSRWVVRITDPEKEVALKEENLEKALELNEDVQTSVGEVGEDIWECSEGDARNLRLLGRVRPAGDGEKEYGSVIEIACRGSKNIENWITNFTAQLAPLGFGDSEAKAHQGFIKAYTSLRDTMLEKVLTSLTTISGSDAGKPPLVYVVGHSLGGALATLAAYDLAVSRYAVRCVTWGCPRVGDATFVRSYRSAVPSTVRFVHRTDVVSRVPVNPTDPFDDGPVLGGSFNALLHRGHAVVGVHEYLHVCQGTKVGRDASAFSQAIASVNTALDQGVASGLSQFLRPHLLSAYADSIHEFFDGAPADAAGYPVDDAAQTARAIGGIMGGLGRGLSRILSQPPSNQ